MLAARGSLTRALALITITLLLSTYFLSKRSTSPPNLTKTDVLLSSDQINFRSACEGVRFDEIRDDRTVWDGVSYKSFFVARDGSLALPELDISTGESVCVVVLLPLTPALTPHFVSSNLSPPDSILTYAVSTTIRYPIELKQHYRANNLYYGPAYFPHPDIYHLKHTVEHRSHFWLQPSRHPYKPTNFESANRVHVKANDSNSTTLPLCTPTNPESLNGRWIKKSKYQSLYPFDFYGMFDDIQEDHALHSYLYVPDWCRLEYTSIGQGTHCLDKKTVHVWGDGHVRRNLKSITTADRWCDTGKGECICNDDAEKFNMFSWTQDPMVSMHFNNSWQVDTQFHILQTGVITGTDWTSRFAEWTEKLPQADLVIFSLGNQDISSIYVDPQAFKEALVPFSKALLAAYPTQRIVIRTPRQFAGGVLHGTSWSAGRSQLFAKLIMDEFQHLPNIVFWDIAKLGVADYTCLQSSNNNYAHRQLVSVENLLFWNAICYKGSNA
ncbi:hypothetical protein BGW37DRAFT_492359 [Umbelopsis sp. PMI_123]|nr:hypothetical protein BGW37DRAFT_492359 [Umbelopsis sp. PMI_123]